MKKLILLLLATPLFIVSRSQVLVLKDSSNNVISSYNPGSKIKKESLITAKKIFFEYSDGFVPEYDFYLSTGVTTPFIKPGVYGNLVSFDFKLHIEHLKLTKEATMVFDVKRLHTKTGGNKMDKGALFYIVE